MTDIFRNKKLVHVKLDKTTHALLRTALFKAGLTMQEILSEFCRQFTNESSHALKVVESYVLRKNAYKSLPPTGRTKARVKKEEQQLFAMTDADKAVIYKMIDRDSPLPSGNDPEKEET